MSPNEIVAQFQQIVETLRRTVEASAGLASRVDILEQESGAKLGVLTDIQGNLKVLLETYQEHMQAQAEANLKMTERISALEARVTALEGDHTS